MNFAFVVFLDKVHQCTCLCVCVYTGSSKQQLASHTH